MIYWQIKFLSFIIHGLAFIEYSFSSTDFKNQVENCISASENCYSVDGRVICYRICSYNRLSWDEAQKICSKYDSTLPIIRNKKEQESLEAFLKARTAISGAVWTSGRKVIHGQWTWLNGQPLGGRVDVESTKLGYDTHVMLKKNNSELKFKQDNPLHSSWYMCQYRGNSCNKNRSLQLNNSCIVLSNVSSSWYAARNVCLDGGGDLAVLNDDYLKILGSHPTTFDNPSVGGRKHYWIGLRKISWQWKFLDDKSEDVKYSKWIGSEFPLDSDLCISIQASNGEWVARPCYYSFSVSVICQNGTTPISTTSTLGPVVPSTSVKNPTESAYVGYVMIGVGVLLIFVCIIFIFLLVRRRLKGTKETRSSKANTKESSNGSDPEEQLTKKKPEATNTAEDDALGAYAEISPPKNSNRDLENTPSNNPHPPSGTVYASLEFKKDNAIYAEPVFKSNTANAQP